MHSTPSTRETSWLRANLRRVALCPAGRADDVDKRAETRRDRVPDLAVERPKAVPLVCWVTRIEAGGGLDTIWSHETPVEHEAHDGGSGRPSVLERDLAIGAAKRLGIDESRYERPPSWGAPGRRRRAVSQGAQGQRTREHANLSTEQTTARHRGGDAADGTHRVRS